MKSLIINADDFGLTKGVNAGIIHCLRNGILTSATAMVNMPAFENAVELAKQHLNLGTGIHLVATLGQPLLPVCRVHSLVNSFGFFHNSYTALVRNMMLGRIRLRELEAEFAAQIERFKDTGLNLTHVDSHQHIHMFPPILDVVVRLCDRYNIHAIRKSNGTSLASGNGIKPKLANLLDKRQIDEWALSVFSHLAGTKLVRSKMATTNHFQAALSSEEATERSLEKALLSLKDGVTEIMCHPGYMDRELEELGLRLSEQREIELRTLTKPSLQSLTKKLGVKLINFGQLV